MQLMSQKVGHQCQKWLFLRVMGQKIGHQPHLEGKRRTRKAKRRT